MTGVGSEKNFVAPWLGPGIQKQSRLFIGEEQQRGGRGCRPKPAWPLESGFHDKLGLSSQANFFWVRFGGLSQVEICEHLESGFIF